MTCPPSSYHTLHSWVCACQGRRRYECLEPRDPDHQHTNNVTDRRQTDRPTAPWHVPRPHIIHTTVGLVLVKVDGSTSVWNLMTQTIHTPTLRLSWGTLQRLERPVLFTVHPTRAENDRLLSFNLTQCLRCTQTDTRFTCAEYNATLKTTAHLSGLPLSQ